MASGQEYLRFILDQLSDCDGITSRPMMGEFLLYCRGKLFGGIYDNRLLVKPVKAAANYLRSVSYETPYPGAKPMLLVDDVDSKAYLAGLLEAMYPELPDSRRKSGGTL